MKRRRILSEEEKRLWEGVARTARPLLGKALPALSGEAVQAGSDAARATARASTPGTGPLPSAGARLAPASKSSLMPSYRAPQAVPQPQAAAFLLHPIDKPVRRRIAKGQLPIEARIDLHDRTQDHAQSVLLAFLRQAQGDGLRLVLVITGRGASFGSRGVIRRALPHWFAMPEFRRLVAGFEPAERAHGGDGAFYVRVRRR